MFAIKRRLSQMAITDHHCRSMMMTRLYSTHAYIDIIILSFLFIFNFTKKTM